jgi:N-acetyl-alpha-D-muramate 1-phosphate uridylyltransferase
MKAMILAAGLGTRMRPLTDVLPKPLLPVGGTTLIELHLQKLASAGINEVVINISYLAEKIQKHLGSGERYGLKIIFSKEERPLETAGGIKNALHLLGNKPFIVVNGDVWSDFPLAHLAAKANNLGGCLAHLVLVTNPDYYPEGDYSLDANARVMSKKSGRAYTFSGLSVLSPSIFEKEIISNRLAGVFSPLFEQHKISAEIYTGQWMDVGTPERFEELKQIISRGAT